MAIKIFKNYPLKDLTTLHVGGSAKYFFEARNKEDIIDVMRFAAEKKLPIFVFSGGSNILVSDDGFDGLVILNKIKGIKHTESSDKVTVWAGAGEDWPDFVNFVVSKNWAGVECLAGIPGSVGGAPVQNIGAYGQEASRVIKEVSAYDTHENKLITLSRKECEFGYRKSIFNTKCSGRYLILEVVFEFKINGGPDLTYQDLESYFEGKASVSKPSLKDVHSAVIEIRARKGMVISSNYESYKTAGSFFKNPIVSKSVFEKVEEKVKSIGGGDGKWFWPQSDGNIKISAARLIELAGFSKGFRVGDVGISPKHSLALINYESAKAKDILDLAEKIINAVDEKFGVRIQPEVIFVGFTRNPLE